MCESSKVTKLIPAKYIERYFAIKKFEKIVKYDLFPNLKEVSESMSMFYVVLEKILPLIDSNRSLENVTIVVVGDGTKPRTASLFNFLSKATTYSIDPLMVERDMFSEIKRLTVKKDEIQNIKIQNNNPIAIILMPHAHAPILESWNCIEAKDKWLVKMPCCTNDKLPWTPIMEFEDEFNISQKRNLIVWREI